MRIEIGKSLTSPISGEVPIEANDYRGNIFELKRFILGAKETILIKCDNFGNILYDNEGIVGSFQVFLERNDNGKVIVIFSEQEQYDKNEACGNLVKTHPNLFRMLTSNIEKWEERFIFYWTPLKPEQHFSIRDSSAVGIEQPSHEPHHRYMLYYYNSPELVKEYREKFEIYLKLLEENQFKCDFNKKTLKNISTDTKNNFKERIGVGC